MKTSLRYAFTVFALAILFTSLLLINLKLPAVAQQPNDPIYLHGPSLRPIHMHGPLLTPVHMHSLIGAMGINWSPYEPWQTPWHQLYPDYCETWTFTSWEDNGNGYLDHSDQIDLTNDLTAEVRWYHVDRVTVTMLLMHELTGELIYVEYKDETWNPPLDPLYHIIPMPVCTWWHEVWPVYHGVFGPGMPYHIIDWIDNGNGYLDFCDWIMFEQWSGEWWHVEEYATDLILNEKIMDPLGIIWHELYPSFYNAHITTSWEEPVDDPFPGRLSPGDQLDMNNKSTGLTKWYHVDRVTFTMRVTNQSDPTQEMYIEYKGPFETMYNIKTTVINSTWHEVYPFYSASMNITSWMDNCNGVLDACDYIEMYDLNVDFYYGWWHVEELAIDIILNEKIDDPTGIVWHELYPDCCVNDYGTLAWEDSGDGMLSPCDNVTLTLLPDGSTYKYHVEEVTLTLNLTVVEADPGSPFNVDDRIYLEFLGGYQFMYHAKTHPLDTDWEVVCPTAYFGEVYTVVEWYDNCNGVLSFWDILELVSQHQTIWCRVDDVAVDMTVRKITEEPTPPPPWYKKPPYPDYAPSGMPDFDQRQGGTYLWQDSGGTWTHCGPVAVANSLWWFDSKFESNTVPPPTMIDNFPLVQAYGPWDDHDPQNVPYLVEHLAYLMDTDGLRTGQLHQGTDVFDMQAGLTHYLSWSGVNPLGDVDGDGIVTQADYDIVNAAMGTSPGMAGWDMRADIFPVTTGYPPFADNLIDANDLALVTANMGAPGMFYERTILAPTWEIIAEEVLNCQDVVLLLVPWYTPDGGQTWYRYDEGGHYVTVAGLNATTWEIVFSDPIRDNAEAGGPGEVPVPHVHPPPEPPYITHNNASLVSHDLYQVIFDPCPGGPLTLPNYMGGAIPPPGPYPSWKVQIEAAVITCPYAIDVHDVAVTNVTTSKTGCTPMPTVCKGYTANVYVAVENQGDFTETFNVTAYAANNTASYSIGELQATLNPAENVILTFTWDTAGFAYGNYTVWVYAWHVPGETDLADNTFVDGWVFVVGLGDVNADGEVDIFDLVTVALALGSEPGDSNWNPNADITNDQLIDVFDLVAIGVNVGQTYSYL